MGAPPFTHRRIRRVVASVGLVAGVGLGACGGDAVGPVDGQALGDGDHRIEVSTCRLDGATATAVGAVFNDSRVRFGEVEIVVRFTDEADVAGGEVVTGRVRVANLEVDEVSRWEVAAELAAGASVVALNCDDVEAIYFAAP